MSYEQDNIYKLIERRWPETSQLVERSRAGAGRRRVPDISPLYSSVHTLLEHKEWWTQYNSLWFTPRVMAMTLLERKETAKPEKPQTQSTFVNSATIKIFREFGISPVLVTPNQPLQLWEKPFASAFLAYVHEANQSSDPQKNKIGYRIRQEVSPQELDTVYTTFVRELASYLSK